MKGIKKMKYYIYTHAINGVVFYIGSNWNKGTKDRAYIMTSRGRTSGWHEYVNNNGGKENVEVNIIEYFNDRLECLHREHELIYEYQDKNLAIVNKEGYKGSRNPMYGKKGKDSPNYGKVRTEEHKKNYRKAASKRICTLKCKKCGMEFKAKGPTTKYCLKCK